MLWVNFIKGYFYEEKYEIYRYIEVFDVKIVVEDSIYYVIYCFLVRNFFFNW